jgi:hypothetical protein
MSASTSPSSDHSGTRVALRVETGSPTAEIFLIDHRLSLVERAVGVLETTQPAGVYKIKVQQGRDAKERMILLTEDTSLEIKPPAFASPAPLSGTARTHEYHVQAAEQHSKKIDRKLGQGATIFLLARYWTGRTPDPSADTSPEHPATGLSIATFDGQKTVEIKDIAKCQSGSEAWAAATIEVAPGACVLRWRTKRRTVIEQTLVASQGWQTQVFLLRRPLHVRRSEPTQAALISEMSNLSILMSKRDFVSSDQDMQLADRARVALADERPVFIEELHRILRGKFENPMLGIFGAHLLLVASEQASAKAAEGARQERLGVKTADPQLPEPHFDQDLFDEVVMNLRHLLDDDHPDVEALSLKCGNPALRTTRPFVIPPMLRRSWSLIVEASNEHPGILPPKTWNRVAMRSPTQPFFSWLSPTDDPEIRSAYLQELRTQVTRPYQREPSRARGAAFSVAGPSAAVAPPTPRTEEQRKQTSIDLDIPRDALDSLLSAAPEPIDLPIEEDREHPRT